jgi:hypothetical protein
LQYHTSALQQQVRTQDALKKNLESKKWLVQPASNQAPDLRIFRVCTSFVHILEFVETVPTEKSGWQNRKGEKQQQRQQQRQQRKGRRQDVRNTLLIIPFVAGSVLTCIDYFNL